MIAAAYVVPGDRVLTTSDGVLTVDVNQPTGEGIRTIVFTSGHTVTTGDDTPIPVVA